MQEDKTAHEVHQWSFSSLYSYTGPCFCYAFLSVLTSFVGSLNWYHVFLVSFQVLLGP